jgi:phosphate transport system substrate-binding protein
VKVSRTSRIAAALAVGAISLTACGGSSDPSSGGGSSSGNGTGTKLSGNLAGAGSSAQQAAMQAWAAGFQAGNPDVTISYDPVGSGGGREQFLSGGVPFAGSDAYLSSDELTKSKSVCAGGTGAIDIPVYVSPIAVAFNLSGVKSLQLSPATIAKIFNDKITKWDDPAIKAENAGVKLPSTAISTVHRSDDSGTTQNFVDYLSKAAGSDWPYPIDDTWAAKGGEGAEGTSGVVAAIKGGEGTIGYADASQVGGLGTAKVKVGSSYVGISASAAAKAAELSKPASGRPAGDLAIDVDRTSTDASAYPLVLISYQVVCQTYKDKNVAALVKAFESYVVSAAGQQAAAKAAGSAPITSAVAAKDLTSIKSIKAAG